MNDASDTAKTEAILKDNETYLRMFEDFLTNLSRRTREAHLHRVEFFLNEYLALQNALPMEAGIHEMGSFLGSFCVRKGVCTSPGSVQSMSASLKKFFQCMAREGKIPEADYDHLTEVLRASLPEWKAAAMAFQHGEMQDYMRIRVGNLERMPTWVQTENGGWVQVED